PSRHKMLEQVQDNVSLGAIAERVLQKNHAEIYAEFLQNHQTTDNDRMRIGEDIRGWQPSPLISVIMPVFNTPGRFLRAAVDSVVCQLYGHWELCIVDDASDNPETLDCLAALDDPRIKIRRLETGRNISAATNAGIAMAAGTYIAFLDHDDSLHEAALYAMVREIQAGDWDLLYSDEDFMDEEGVRVHAHFKPDFSPQLLEAHNYITHLVVVRRSLAEQVGLLRSEFDGAQDYDFLLRVSSLTRKIWHIPKVLYHWRMSDTSTAKSSEAKPETTDLGRRALLDYLHQKNQSGEVRECNLPNYYEIHRHIDKHPKVSIVIPFKDRPDLLQRCVRSILERRTYTNIEIIGVSNNAELSSTFAMMDQLSEHPEVRFVERNVPFNFSDLVNFGVAESDGEVAVLMNNDIEIISWDWIERMLEHAVQSDIGAVGGKLFYPDNTIQHAGVIVGIGGYAGHAFKGFRGNAAGYYNLLNITCNYAAVTGAFMMIERSKYEQLGGFDAKQFKVACNDVDFCLRLLEQGYYNVYTPFAKAYHWESLSRGYEDTPAKKRRFTIEKAQFCERHKRILERGDPFYNANLTLDEENFGLAG
ncbi:MAG TPA: glycosyltransferase, partial [Gammaproteobacteria bacterium]|nr:glycosyltransferase [Gammaproteobacteria bacterium]